MARSAKANWRARSRSLCRELSQAEAIRLVQDFVREQFVTRGIVADLNLHWGVAAALPAAVSA